MSLHDELLYQYIYEKNGAPDAKDIIVVVHDQLDFIKKCINSLYLNTKNFTLYLWDNDSMAPTREYMEEVARSHDNVVLVRNSENAGFVIPNNKLAKVGKSPYIILLNSDTEVKKGWDTALIGWLVNNPNCGIVGYQGGILEGDGKGRGIYGSEVDYICGWCLCIKRETYERYGLFDEEHILFAYAEDSDLSLRIQEAGLSVHALQMNLVRHYGNATALNVCQEIDTSFSFHNNHEYIRKRWSDYLANKRVMVRSAANQNAA